MDQYERSYLGNIVIISNLVFSQAVKEKNRVDHAWHRGRPCVIFFTDGEYDYFMPLSSTKRNKNYYDKIKDEYFELSKEDFLSLNKNQKIGVIHITEHFRKRASGYPTIGKLTKECYTELIKRFSAYHKEPLERVIKNSIKR